MIAVVSYNNGALPVTNVLIQDNDGADQNWGRGISVVGGQGITIERNKVAVPHYALGILLASEPVRNSQRVSNVLVRKNTLADNSSAQPCNGAILVSGLAPEKIDERVNSKAIPSRILDVTPSCSRDQIAIRPFNNNTTDPEARVINIASGHECALQVATP